MTKSEAKNVSASERALSVLAQHVVDFFDHEDLETLTSATATLRNHAQSILLDYGSPVTRHQSPVTPEQVSDPARFFCPHCGGFRPGYGFNYQRHNLPGIGVVGYMIIYCAGETCRKILTNALIEFTPDPGAAAAGMRGGPRIF